MFVFLGIQLDIKRDDIIYLFMNMNKICLVFIINWRFLGGEGFIYRLDKKEKKGYLVWGSFYKQFGDCKQLKFLQVCKNKGYVWGFFFGYSDVEYVGDLKVIIVKY